MYDGNAQVSFAKLSDDSWGVRIASRRKGNWPQVSTGDEVLVRKANGEHSRVTLGSVVDRDRGAFPGPAVYFRIRRDGGGGPTRPSHLRQRRVTRKAPGYKPNPTREQERQAIIEAGLKLREEIDREQALVDDGEYWDGEEEIRDEARAKLARKREALIELRQVYRTRYLGRAA